MPEPNSFDTTTWIALGLAALAGLETLLRGLSMILHAIAPRTKTTVDDRLAVDVDEIHDKLDVLLAMVPRQPQAVPVTVKRDPQTGFVSGDLLAVLLPIGITIGIVCVALACGSTTKGVATSAKAALVNCTGQQIGTTPALDAATLVAVVNLVATEHQKCTPVGGSIDWKCVETDLLAQGRVLGGCTLIAMVASAATPSAGKLPASAAPPPGALELADFCARGAPGTAYHLATGDFPCP